MPSAYFRFYAELNDFLPRARQQTTFAHAFQGRVAVKDMIEALGVPHPEVDLIIVNGVSVDFAYLVQAADQISVYPVFETFDIAPLQHLRPQPLRQPRFVLDTHLGTLARYLRLLGFDTLYRNDYPDAELARISAEEQRIVLTKDRGVLKRGQVTHGYCVRAAQPRQQVREVLAHLHLADAVKPFSRCLRCNGTLQPVDRAAIADRLPAEAGTDYTEFYLCQTCRQLYWPGSHYAAMTQLVASFLAEAGPTPGDSP